MYWRCIEFWNNWNKRSMGEPEEQLQGWVLWSRPLCRNRSFSLCILSSVCSYVGNWKIISAFAGNFGCAVARQGWASGFSLLLAEFAGFEIKCVRYMFFDLNGEDEKVISCYSLHSVCRCVLILRKEQEDFYIMCLLCWNLEAIFLVLLLIRLRYGKYNFLIKFSNVCLWSVLSW